MLGEILGSALSIWNHKEKSKYFEQWRKLMRAKHDEYEKPVFNPNKDENKDASSFLDQSVIDHADFELFLLARNWQALVGQPDFAN